MNDGDEPAKASLKTVYQMDPERGVKDFYADWATNYDAELAAAGYVTPGRCADALAQTDPSLRDPVLDLGCGTGLSGKALRAAGFGVVDGCDFSAEMLAVAGKTGAYRRLWTADLSEPVRDPDTGEAPEIVHAMAAGVFSPGHAPDGAIPLIMELLPPGGLFSFSLNDHALAERVYEARINDLVDAGGAEILFKEHGAHVPSENLEATVYVLARR